MTLAGVDAVTLDAYGTLLELEDPVPELVEALLERGVERGPQDVGQAFAAEVEHYRPRSLQGRDRESLAHLREECVAVFLAELEVEIDPAAFLTPFLASLRFRPLPGAAQALERLSAHGLVLAIVSNWDCSLPGRLRAAGLDHRVATVVTSAEAGVAKPDPHIFALALERLGISAERALHVGDSAEDELGAAAAGLRYLCAPVPRVLAE